MHQNDKMPYIDWLKFLNDNYKREFIPYDEIKLMSKDNQHAWGVALPKLETLRALILKEIKYDIKENINSSFRSEERNKKVAGSKNSLHSLDFAIDIQLDVGHKMIDILSSDKDEIHKLGFYYIFYKESTDATKHKNWVHIQLKKLEGDKRCMTLYDKKKAI